MYVNEDVNLVPAPKDYKGKPFRVRDLKKIKAFDVIYYLFN